MMASAPGDPFGTLREEIAVFRNPEVLTVTTGSASEAVALATQAIGESIEVIDTINGRDGDRTISDEALTSARLSILNAVAAEAFDDLEQVALAQAKPESARTGQYLKAYFQAYFRSGRFAKLHLDPTELKNRVIADLRENLAGKLPDDEIDRLAQLLTEKFSPTNFGVVNDESFVARGGKTYQFKEITLSVSPGAERQVGLTKIDGVEVVGEITRIFFEALFDALHQLPAVTNATGTKLSEGLIENRVCTDAEQQSDKDACDLRAARVLDDATFEKVESIASRVDGATLALTGSYLRGVSWFSLNNEYLATFLETAIAVTARKNAEKIAWCYYRCPKSVQTTSFSESPVPLETVEMSIVK